MNIWRANSERNLLPISENQIDFKIALKEWHFNGGVIDHEGPIETCQLCEHSELRYHFKIVNSENENELWVGSKCIDKFDIKVYDESGVEVSEKKEAYLKKLMKKKQLRETLIRLVNTTPTTKINEYHKRELDTFCFDKFNNDDYLDARMLNYMFIRFEEEQIPFEKKLFSIEIRSDKGKAQLLKLNEIQFERIKGALSSSQINHYKNNKE